MIKHLSLRCILLLLDLYNEIFSSHSIPDDWTKSQIILIKKSDGCSFRPISLTSCVCKVFERLINTRLQWWCEYHDVIPTSQAGFRAGPSCVDNVMNLTLYAEGSLYVVSTRSPPCWVLARHSTTCRGTFCWRNWRNWAFRLV